MTAKEPKTRKKPDFRKEERDELRYQLSVWLAAAFSWFCFFIPPTIRNWIAERIGMIFYRNTHTYRDNVKDNVRQVLGPDADEDEVSRNARSIFRNSALNFLDLLTLPRRANKNLLRATHVVEGDWSIVRDAIATGRGVIFVSGHVGCFDFIGQALIAQDLKLTVVTGRTTSRFIFDGVTWLRSKRGGTFVEPTPSGVRSVIRALRRGECAVFVADRDFFENGHEVEFFGRQTTLPPGPIRIARDTGAIVIPMFTRRVKRGHEVRIHEPFEVEKTKDVQADVRRGLEKLVPVLEHGISDAIDQWVMFQRVWPERPVEPVKIFPTGSPLESELLEKVASHLPEIRTGEGSS